MAFRAKELRQVRTDPALGPTREVAFEYSRIRAVGGLGYESERVDLGFVLAHPELARDLRRDDEGATRQRGFELENERRPHLIGHRDGAGRADERGDGRVWIVRLPPRGTLDVRRGDRDARRLELRAHDRRFPVAVKDETRKTLAGEDLVTRQVEKVGARGQEKRAETPLAQLRRRARSPVRDARSFARHPFCIRE